MKTRVLLPLLVFGLIAVIAILLPTAQSIAQSRTQELVLQRSAALDEVVQRARSALVRADTDGLQAYLERFHEIYGESVLVMNGFRDVVAAAGDLTADTRVAELATAAARSIPQWSLPPIAPWGPDTALVAVPVITAGDLSTGAVILEVDLRTARADVAAAWAGVGGVGLVLLSVLMAASLAWTRWVLRPVRVLDDAVSAISEHRDPASTRPSGPPEFRRLARRFRAMAQEVEASLEQQRGFVADASHQLRTPLAAIRLRVDALERSPDDAAELEAVDDDLDRLEHTVQRMLALADAEHQASVRTHGPAQRGDLEESRSCTAGVGELVERHRPLLADAGIELVVDEDEPLTLPTSRADLDEMIDVLLDNAAKYAGPGTVRAGGAATQDATVIDIEDTGGSLDDEDLERMGTRFWRSNAHRATPGTGLGLAIVDHLMMASGGRLELSRSERGGLRARLVWERS